MTTKTALMSSQQENGANQIKSYCSESRKDIIERDMFEKTRLGTNVDFFSRNTGIYTRKDISIEERIQIVSDCLGSDSYGKVSYWSEEKDISRQTIHLWVNEGKEKLFEGLSPKKRGPKKIENKILVQKDQIDNLKELILLQSQLIHLLTNICQLESKIISFLLTFLKLFLPFETFIKRLILDLKMKGVSNNDITDFFNLHFKIKISEKKVRDILAEASKISKKKSLEYLKKIKNFPVLCIDEIFNNKNGLCLVASADNSNLMLKIKFSKDRSKNGIKLFLDELFILKIRPVYIITDLYKVYKNNLISWFSNCYHQFCLVHARWIVNEYIKPLEKSVKRYKTKHTELKDSLETLRYILKNLALIKEKKLTTANLTAQIRDLKSKKLLYETKLDSLERKSRKHKNYKNKLFETEKEINQLDKLKRNLQKLFKNDFKFDKRNINLNIKKTEKKIKENEKILFEKNNKLVKLNRIRKKLFKAFSSYDKIKIMKTYDEIQNELKSIPGNTAKRIHKFLKNNKNELFAYTKFLSNDGKCYIKSVRSNNTAENVNGFIRKYITNVRYFQTDKSAQIFLDLIQFYYNSRKFHTSNNKGKCPWELAGLNLESESYLDDIFPLTFENKKCKLNSAQEIEAIETLVYKPPDFASKMTFQKEVCMA